MSGADRRRAMRMTRIGIVASALALLACGQEKPKTQPDAAQTPEPEGSVSKKDGIVRFETKDGGAVFLGGENVTAPKDLPSFVEVYPGLRLDSVMSGEAAGDFNGGGVLAGISADPPEKIAAHYREVITRRGLRIVLDRVHNGTIVLNAAGQAGEGLYLTITPKDGGSQVGLTYATASPAPADQNP